VIIGIGADLADIRRIAGTLQRHGERFTHRVFTEVERTRSDNKPAPAASYAKRWAAKEACSKALGSGVRMGVAWREMGVVNLPSGQPTLHLEGGARARLDGLTPAGHTAHIHLTMTDDDPYAQAFVVIEARPDSSGT